MWSPVNHEYYLYDNSNDTPVYSLEVKTQEGIIRFIQDKVSPERALDRRFEAFFS